MVPVLVGDHGGTGVNGDAARPPKVYDVAVTRRLAVVRPKNCRPLLSRARTVIASAVCLAVLSAIAVSALSSIRTGRSSEQGYGHGNLLDVYAVVIGELGLLFRSSRTEVMTMSVVVKTRQASRRCNRRRRLSCGFASGGIAMALASSAAGGQPRQVGGDRTAFTEAQGESFGVGGVGSAGEYRVGLGGQRGADRRGNLGAGGQAGQVGGDRTAFR